MRFEGEAYENTFIQRHKYWISKSACSKTVWKDYILFIIKKQHGIRSLTKCKQWQSDHVCLLVLWAECSSTVVNYIWCTDVVWHFKMILINSWSFKDIMYSGPKLHLDTFFYNYITLPTNDSFLKSFMSLLLISWSQGPLVEVWSSSVVLKFTCPSKVTTPEDNHINCEHVQLMLS